MRFTRTNRSAGVAWLLTMLILLCVPAAAMAQDAPAGGTTASAGAQDPPKQQVLVQATADKRPSFEIYGFAMLDIGHDFKQIDPDWFDTLRLTRLPQVPNEFGEDNNTFAGVRQSRLGFRSSTPTALGELKTIFEFELFGTGVDSGQTTFRLRHAWGELGALAAGQVPGALSPTLMCSRTRWNTGGPRVFRGSATCSFATRRSRPIAAT